MGYKTTTDPFVLRAKAKITVNGTGAVEYTPIDTSLDTLNREVLLIWEVDIMNEGYPPEAISGLAQLAGGELLQLRQTLATEEDNFLLSDRQYIAGKDTQVISSGGGAANPVFQVVEFANPDSNTMVSRDKIPLAIVVNSEIYFRNAFSASTSLSTSEGFTSHVRILAQRAKADSETYAALVTGLL